ncbi:hypothetical protein HYH02_011244 [Chlamydomonas schloesseri]|uniref:RING-type E3 ubiquitin transferase n=1 Tax=Chlamydomonas schloesseri TaxID=2026947 RepID=A0A835T2F6_9CHLO|nr:hypothetical protein HYH02_011244 [Chlamydomonas schloesseri]|eukprot:KAG2437604.1 hypothetical protein HYH02_011244 [Chlamydomonas schloesseri]
MKEDAAPAAAERPADAPDAADAGPGPSSAAVAAAAGSAGLFRRKKGGANIRKRGGVEGGSDDDEAGGGVVRKAKAAKSDAPLAFTTKKDDKDALLVEFAGSKALQDGKDTLATRVLETETEYDRDARAQREAVLKQATDGAAAGDDGTYKGMNAYVDYRKGFRREHTVAAEKGTGSHGPLRGNAYVRVTARFDYQPDVCKDYKETGYCSYGDTCKFMHDRGDYKSGWELDKMWEEEQKRKAEALAKGWNPDGDGEEDEEQGGGREDDELPFACFICREPWEACKSPPVVTRCKHYFCEKCALKHNAKTSKCAVCGVATQGIFNVAQDIVKRQKRMAG